MLYTSAEAAKLLKSLNSEYNSLLYKEQQGCTFVAAVQEDIEECRPDYDYENMQEQLTAVESKIRRVKHAINKFNVTTMVPGFDMTIDQLLVYIPQLSRKQQKLSELRIAPPRTRVDHYQSNIIDYQYINYDLKQVEQDYRSVSDELARAQIALDKLNTTKTFEI